MYHFLRAYTLFEFLSGIRVLDVRCEINDGDT